MGHWLDPLLGGPGVTIEWDGAVDPFPQRRVLFFDEEFEVVDDPAAKKTRIAVRFVSMAGDVTESTDENRVTSISGDDESNVVSMFATALQWDSDAAETEPTLKLGGDGAIELWNDGKRSVAASADGPVLGNTTAISKLVGGLQISRRLINTTPVTLDATSKAILLMIDASVERTVNLPAPTDARVFFWVLVGGTANITIARHASELINSAASNYTPQDNSRGIIFSDGVDWYTFAGLE